MPIGNPMGYIKKAKGMASRMAGGRSSGISSGSAASKRLSGVQNYVKNNKAKSAMIGGGAAMGIGGISRTRRSGLDKNKGRPTGMYKY
jgi:hypothetical protein